jgi:hypothetical protein
MAWEISHSQEAFDNARHNLALWDRDKLIDALSDDAFELAEQGGHSDPADAAQAVLELLEDTPQDLLVDICMTTIEDHRTCSNGGHDFWIDREGFHTVPVDFQAPEDSSWAELPEMDDEDKALPGGEDFGGAPR